VKDVPKWFAVGMSRRARVVTWLGWVMAGGSAFAQSGLDGFNVPWIADTSVSVTRQTQVLQLGPEDGRGLPDRLQYEIGFSTFETAATGFLFDSLTITLARGDGTGSTVLVTGDVFGLTIAPLAPGGLLASGGISVNETVPRVAGLEGATVSFAYTVEVTLPATLSGAELRTSFDFFNNGDAVGSRGYAMVVPEPQSWLLMALAVGLGSVARWKRGGRA